MDLEQLEALALADDRAAAVADLLPGTVDHDCRRGVHLQHQGKLDEVDAILAGWWARHHERGELHGRLEEPRVESGGGVQFYKDGYTDLRGRFDYVTLSTDDLDRVERFAILVAADGAGATVLEAPPPQR